MPQQECHQAARQQEARDPGRGAPRWPGSRCIHTAVSMMRSKRFATRVHLVEIGQRIVDPGDRCLPVQALAVARAIPASADATTVWPRAARAAASRPGAGTDIEDAGLARCGMRCRVPRWTSAKIRLPYRSTSASAVSAVTFCAAGFHAADYIAMRACLAASKAARRSANLPGRRARPRAAIAGRGRVS